MFSKKVNTSMSLLRYLCIICYPGMVGCQDMKTNTSLPAPARQKNRRRAKDKIKVGSLGRISLIIDK
jgi:hypothetical protein